MSLVILMAGRIWQLSPSFFLNFLSYFWCFSSSTFSNSKRRVFFNRMMLIFGERLSEYNGCCRRVPYREKLFTLQYSFCLRLSNYLLLAVFLLNKIDDRYLNALVWMIRLCFRENYGNIKSRFIRISYA